MNHLRRTLFMAAAGFALAVAQAPAETIYHGGAILTMADDAPRVEAVAVAGRRILASGTEAEVMAHRGRR